MQLVFKYMDYENELEKNYEKLDEWLDKCPFEWQEVSHPTSGITTINITMIKDE
jgi:hypothetical protein